MSSSKEERSQAVFEHSVHRVHCPSILSVIIHLQNHHSLETLFLSISKYI
jgi:hypothetical protein